MRRFLSGVTPLAYTANHYNLLIYTFYNPDELSDLYQGFIGHRASSLRMIFAEGGNYDIPPPFGSSFQDLGDAFTLYPSILCQEQESDPYFMLFRHAP